MALATQFALIRDVIDFVLSSDLCVVMESHFGVVQDVGRIGASISGYSLESSERHRQMIDDFELRLQTFIEARGSSAEAFQQLCRRAAAYTPAVSAFVALLDIVTDFEVFVSMSNDNAKREYMRATMANYRRMIQAQPTAQSVRT